MSRLVLITLQLKFSSDKGARGIVDGSVPEDYNQKRTGFEIALNHNQWMVGFPQVSVTMT